jgi:hypothetical protein
MKFVKILAIVAVLAALGIGIGWFGSRPMSTPSSQVGATTEPVKIAPNQPSAPTRPPPLRDSARALPAPQPEVPTATLPVSVGDTNLITDWEDRLDEILGSEAEEAQKADALLGMFPRLPEAGQVDIALHLSNLVEDENYAGFGQYLTNSALSEDVLDVLLSDLLNRPNGIKLPMLIGVARDPRNPKAAEAKDLLELYLEEDYGSDWATWGTKAEEWLKENPD